MLYHVMYRFFKHEPRVCRDTIPHVLRIMLADGTVDAMKFQTLDLICRNERWIETVQYFVASHESLNRGMQSLFYTGMAFGRSLAMCAIM